MWGTRGEDTPSDDTPRERAPGQPEVSAMAESSGNGSELQTQWARVRGHLREEFGEPAYRSWLRQLTLVGLGGGVIRIAVPTRFTATSGSRPNSV